jgi:2-polyprenyl-3-methyl-5-hydroxy-6-metoxy-1,4-benzoquinol methylase
MAIFRVKHNDFEQKFDAWHIDTLETNEWENTTRLKEQGWDSRYDYEAQMLKEVIMENRVEKVLEIGSGPGILSQKIQNLMPPPKTLEYDLVDKPFAKKYFDENKFKGKFFVKDISVDLDPTGLKLVYDLIIINDTLEHLIAPSNVVKQMVRMMDHNSVLFVSVPNWRMAHQFLYRGLWDYDNFIYFMHIHGLEMEAVYPSCLQTPDYPKTDNEDEMPEELRRSWNWYFVLKLKTHK